MAIQKLKNERILIDRGNIYDPGNNHYDRDCNPKGHKQITDDIINTYIQCGKFNCELNYQKKILKLDIEPPECFNICCKKVGIHGCGADSTYPVAEFMTRWMKKDPNQIFIKRSDALFNWYYKLPFIFRPSWQNKYHLHHWKYPLYDSPEFTVMIKDDLHAKLNAKTLKIRKKILEIEEVIRIDQNKYFLYKAEISRLYNEMEKINRVDTDPDFWVYIDEYHKYISNLREV